MRRILRRGNTAISMASLPGLIDEYDALMHPYLKNVGRGNEIDWSLNSMNKNLINQFCQRTVC
jgi:hypothetical protein